MALVVIHIILRHRVVRTNFLYFIYLSHDLCMHTDIQLYLISSNYKNQLVAVIIDFQKKNWLLISEKCYTLFLRCTGNFFGVDKICVKNDYYLILRPWAKLWLELHDKPFHKKYTAASNSLFPIIPSMLTI